MRFTLNTDTDTITFEDGLEFSVRFIHRLLTSPKGTIIEFLGATTAGPVTLKSYELGSTVNPPPSNATVDELVALTKKT